MVYTANLADYISPPPPKKGTFETAIDIWHKYPPWCLEDTRLNTSAASPHPFLPTATQLPSTLVQKVSPTWTVSAVKSPIEVLCDMKSLWINQIKYMKLNRKISSLLEVPSQNYRPSKNNLLVGNQRFNELFFLGPLILRHWHMFPHVVANSTPKTPRCTLWGCHWFVFHMSCRVDVRDEHTSNVLGKANRLNQKETMKSCLWSKLQAVSNKLLLPHSMLVSLHQHLHWWILQTRKWRGCQINQRAMWVVPSFPAILTESLDANLELRNLG